jgi:hypothetical protein
VLGRRTEDWKPFVTTLVQGFSHRGTRQRVRRSANGPHDCALRDPGGQSRADNPERATKFYCELFGWEIQKWASSGAKSPSDTGRPE